MTLIQIRVSPALRLRGSLKAVIPLLIASNAEAGGNGACTDGTYVGYPIKLGATADPQWAYEMGRISGVESSAIGCNWAFAPVVDLLINWRNPIISNRAFGSDPHLVLECGKAYLKGMAESGVACAMKHFPGDGVDERDHHLSSSVNSMTMAEWDATFGKVYSGMIEAGVQSIMVGHIMLPAYQTHFSPQFKDADLLGFPLRLMVGSKGLKDGVVELRDRRTKEVVKVAPDAVLASVRQAKDRIMESLETAGGR